MSLNYETASESLHIYVKKSLSNCQQTGMSLSANIMPFRFQLFFYKIDQPRDQPNSGWEWLQLRPCLVKML